MRTVRRLFVSACLGGGLLAHPAAADPLIDVAWLAARVCTDEVVVLDVRRSRADHETGHVPCAVFTNFYTDGWRETRAGVPMVMPQPAQTAELLGQLGIRPDDHVVIVAPGTGRYDGAEAAAIFVSLRTVGHTAVSILDGGFEAWTAEWENDVDTGYRPRPATTYAPRPAAPIIADRTEVMAAIEAGRPLLDLRTSDQYLGLNRNETVLRHGTLPGARNAPMAWFFVDGTLEFHTRAVLGAALAHTGLPAAPDPVVFCNAGLESALGWFVLHELLGRTGSRLYDGSLAEWSREPDLPLERAIRPPG